MNGRALSERGICKTDKMGETAHGAGDRVLIKHCLNVKTLKRDNQARMSVSPILTFFPNLFDTILAGGLGVCAEGLGSVFLITLS
jgi:hypothetical protein